MFNNFNVKNLLIEIELYIETRDLRAMKMSEEEIVGYFELYVDSWIDDLLERGPLTPN